MVRDFMISTIVGILFLVLNACNSKQVNSPSNQKVAQDDIKAGNVKRFSLGLSILNRIPLQQLDSLQTKYGFRDENLGCLANDSLENAIKEYNADVNKYLVNRNGIDWEKRYYTDVFRMVGVKQNTTP